MGGCIQYVPCAFVMCFLLFIPHLCMLLTPYCFSHASVFVTVSNSFLPQVPASVDRCAGDLSYQPGCDRADVFKLRPAASLPDLLPTGERPASAGCCLPL